MVPSRGGDLYQDVDVVSGSVSVELGNVTSVTVDHINVVMSSFNIYDSTTEEEIKSNLTVTAYYSDNTSHVISDYDVYLTGNGDQATILVQYGEQNNPDNQETIIKTFSPNEISKLENIIVDGGYIESYYDANDLKRFMDVVVSKSDGKLHYLEDYDVAGDLYPGSEKPVNTEEFPDFPYVKKTITITPKEGGESLTQLKSDFEISVKPNTPGWIIVNLLEENAFDAFRGGPLSAVEVTVFYTSSDFKQVQSGYHFVYVNEETKERISSESPEDVKNNLGAGEYKLYVVYEENGKPSESSPIDITVNKVPLKYPSILPETHTYSAELQSWVISDFVEGITVPSIRCTVHGTSTGADSECRAYVGIDSDGQYKLFAMHQATYTLTFKLSEEGSKNYIWDGDIDEYNVTISRGLPVILLNSDDSGLTDWIYGEVQIPKFSAKLSGGSTTLKDGEIDWDKTHITFSNGTTEIECLYSEISNLDPSRFSAGDWTVSVVIPEEASDNLLQATEQFPFSILKNTLTPSAADSEFTYDSDKKTQIPTINITGEVEYGNFSEMFTCDAKGYVAGEYIIRVILKEEYRNNYQWSGDNTTEFSTTWNIKSRTISAPTVSPTSEDSYYLVYDGSAKKWTLSNNEGTVFDTENFELVSVTCEIMGKVYEEHGLSLSNDGLSAIQAGTYTITLGIKDNIKSVKNYVWADGTDPKLSVTISQKDLGLTVGIEDRLLHDSNALWYDDPEPIFVDLNDDTDGFTLVMTGLRDNDSDDINLNVDTTYTKGDMPKSYKITATLESRNYYLSTSEWDFNVVKRPLNITSATVDPITYLDEAPNLSDYSFYSDGQSINSLIGDKIKISIQTEYQKGCDAKGYDNPDSGYEIKIWADSDYYKISISEPLGYLVVERLGVYLDWSSSVFEFDDWNTRLLVLKTDVSADGISDQVFSTEGLDIKWYDGSVPPQEVTNFAEGDYSVKITMDSDRAKNYTFIETKTIEGSSGIETHIRSIVNPMGNELEAEFQITYAQIPLNITISDDLDRHYGVIDDESLKAAIDLSVPEEYEDDLAGVKYDLTNFSFRVGTGNTVEGLDVDTYTLTVYLNGVQNLYMYATTNLTILNRVVDVKEPTFDGTLKYNGEDQKFTLSLPKQDVYGDIDVTWEFSMMGSQPIKSTGNSIGLTIPNADADSYTFTYTITAENHEFEYGDDATCGTITITVDPADMNITFGGSDDGQYEGVYGETLYDGPRPSSGGADAFVEPVARGLDDTPLEPTWKFDVYTKTGNDYPTTATHTVDSWDGLMEIVAIPGDYKVVYKATSTNYLSSGMICFITSNATLSFVYELDGDEQSPLSESINVGYSGAKHALVIKALRDGEVVNGIKWTLTIDGSNQVVEPGSNVMISKTQAASYEITISATKTYYEQRSYEFTFTINKASIQSIVVPDNPRFIYGDEIIMSGSASSSVLDLVVGWTWTFDVSKVLDDETTSDVEYDIIGWDGLITALQKKEVGVGIYRISYVVSEVNHDDSTEGSFNLTIDKRVLTLTPGFDHLTYGDYAPGEEEGDVSSALEAMVGNFAYKQPFDEVFGDNSLNINYERGDDVSAYYIDGKYLDMYNANYDTSGLYFTFDVEPFTLKLTVSDDEAEFDLPSTVNLNATIVNDSVPFGTQNLFDLKIYVDNDGAIGREITAEEAVLNYGERYLIVAEPLSNNYVVDANKGTLTIGKQILKITFSSEDFTYDGEVLQPSDVIGLFNLPTDIFTKDFIEEYVSLSFIPLDGDTLDEGTQYPIDAGSYQVSMILSDDCSYDVSLGADAIFEIEKASYKVNVNFGSVKEVTFGEWSGDGYEFPIYVTDTSNPGSADSVALKTLLVKESDYDRDVDLTVKYFIDGEEINGYPIFNHVKGDNQPYTVYVKFAGSDNYVVPSNINTTFTVYQASNGWSYGWGENYLYADSEYSELDIPLQMDSIFGDVTFEYYFGDSADSGNKLDGAPTEYSPVGTYFVKAYVTETYDYRGVGPYEYTFTISKKVLDPVWKDSSLGFTGSSVNNSLVVMGDDGTIDGADTELIKQMVNSGAITYTIEAPEDASFEFDVSSLSMSAVSEGQYTIILEMGGEYAKCYTFTEGEDVDIASETWYITSDHTENYWKIIPHIDSWTYGEEPATPVGQSKYNNEGITFAYYKDGEESTPSAVVPSEPGTYKMVVTVPKGTIHTGDGEDVSYAEITHTVEFTISKIFVNIPENAAIQRDGDAHQPYVENEHYTIMGDTSEFEVGDYEVTLSLKDPDHCMWSDGTTDDKTLFWRIVPAGDLVEEYFSVDTTPVTYNGSAFEKTVVCRNPDLKLGVDYEVSYKDNLAAGTGFVIITGLGAFEDSEPLEFSFEIEKAKPVLDFVNNGFEKSDDSEAFTLNPYTSGLSDGDIQWISSDPSVAEVDPLTGEVTVKAIGQVTITATFVGDDNREQVSDSYDLNIEDGQTEVYVDRVVYIRVPVTDPDDPDDPTDDKPDEPAIVYKNDNTLYIILLLVLAAVCVCFAAYIMYTHRKQEDQGGGQI